MTRLLPVLVFSGFTSVASAAGENLADKLVTYPSSARCLLDLCGPQETTSLENPLLRPKGHIQQVEGDLQLSIEPLIQAHLTHSAWVLENNRKLLQFMQSAKITKLTLPEDIRIFLNFNLVSQYFSALAQAGGIKSDAKGDLKLDEPFLGRVLAASGVKDKNGLALGIRAMLKSGIVNVMAFRGLVTISNLYGLAFAHLSYEDFIKTAVHEIRVWRERLAMLEDFGATIRPSQIVRKFDSGEPITDDESAVFFDEMIQTEVARTVFSDADFRKVLLGFKRDFLAELKDQIKTLSESSAPNDSGVRAKNVHDFCMAQYSRKMMSFPTEDELGYFRTTYSKSIKLAAINVLKRENLSDFSPRIANLKWRLPVNYKKSLGALIDDLKTSIELNDGLVRNRTGLWNGLRAGDNRSLSVAAVTVLMLDSESFAQGFEDVKASCESVKPTELVDSSIALLGAVNVSWQTILALSDPSHVIGHEMGHLVYQAAQKGQLEPVAKRVQCLVKKHAGLDANGSRFVEEDYADLFGLAVQREMKNGAMPERDIFCFVRPTDETIATFHTLKSPDIRDSHSAVLFRMAILANERGVLPASCRNLKTEANAPNLLNQCWSR